MDLNNILITVFLISYIYKTNGDEINYSLTFVIDSTRSMQDEIDAVKEKTNQVFDAVLKSESNQIKNFVLVTFTDYTNPVTRAKTTSPYEFKNELANIRLVGNKDCPESSLGGILLGLKESEPNSYIYVFTDASARDVALGEKVKSLSNKMSSQITFLLTGKCGSSTAEDYLVYYDIAKSTGGQVFNLLKSNVMQIIDYIAEVHKSPTTILADKNINNIDEINISLDSDIKSVTVLVNGEVNQLLITDSIGNVISTEALFHINSAQAVKFSGKPGSYTIKINSNGTASVKIYGSTDVFIQHGFSYKTPETIADTITQPVSGYKTYLYVALTNKDKDIKLETWELRDMKGNVKEIIPLKQISVNGDQQFYVSEPFTTPENMFKVAINGYKSSEERVTRVALVPIQPIRPGDIPVPPMSPNVSLLSDSTVSVKLNAPFTSTCKVEAYPKPDVIWKDEYGNTFEPEIKILNLPYAYTSVLNVDKLDKNTRYYCKAKNSEGYGTTQVDVKLLEGQS